MTVGFKVQENKVCVCSYKVQSILTWKIKEKQKIDEYCQFQVDLYHKSEASNSSLDMMEIYAIRPNLCSKQDKSLQDKP